MKRSKFIVALAVLLMLTLTLPALAETVRLAYKDGSLYIRSGAGTGYEAVGTVHNGDWISVLSKGSVWSKIKTGSGKVGYIKNLYIASGDGNYASGTSYFDGGYTVYTTGNVNFRAGASTSTASMGTLAKGTKLTALGKNGNFYLVKNAKGTQGYVSANYISRTKPSGSASSSSSSSGAITRTVTASYVNIREGGGMSTPVLAVVKRGTVVTQLYRGNYWTKINYRGLVGWIKNSYLK